MPTTLRPAAEIARETGPTSAKLAVEAVEILSAAIRQLMRSAGCDQAAIDNEAKRHRRLCERLRAGRARVEDVRFVANALRLAAALHEFVSERSVGAAAAASPATARAFERASREVWTRPAPVARWPIGTRLVEIESGAVWWVDELAVGRTDLVGVIPDNGAAAVVWRKRSEFVRAGR